MTSAQTRGAVLEVLVDAADRLTAYDIATSLSDAGLLPANATGHAISMHVRELAELDLIFRDDCYPTTGKHRCRWRATAAGVGVVASARRQGA